MCSYIDIVVESSKHHNIIPGNDHNQNTTYYSFLRDFDVLMSSLNILMLLSVSLLLARLNRGGCEYHSQYRSIGKVYQHTIHIQQKQWYSYQYSCYIIHCVE